MCDMESPCLQLELLLARASYTNHVSRCSILLHTGTRDPISQDVPDIAGWRSLFCCERCRIGLPHRQFHVFRMCLDCGSSVGTNRACSRNIIQKLSSTEGWEPDFAALMHRVNVVKCSSFSHCFSILWQVLKHSFHIHWVIAFLPKDPVWSREVRSWAKMATAPQYIYIYTHTYGSFLKWGIPKTKAFNTKIV